jgi:hypothetical protein
MLAYIEALQQKKALLTLQLSQTPTPSLQWSAREQLFEMLHVSQDDHILHHGADDHPRRSVQDCRHLHKQRRRSAHRPNYQDIFDLHEAIVDDDSDTDERDGDYADDNDRSSSLSIPNESIDFNLVYSLHSFSATVEGQASVVKGDNLVLMDDSNSYWWLVPVRVLKTQEIGYIPAENIEMPFKRLTRLNKHHNVDVCAPSRPTIYSRNNSCHS